MHEVILHVRFDDALIAEWVSTNESQIQDILVTLFRTFKDDVSSSQEIVINQLRSLLAEDTRRMIPSDACLEACKMRERMQVTQEKDAILQQSKLELQQQIDTLKQDNYALSESIKRVNMDKQAMQANVDSLVQMQISQKLHEAELQQKMLENEIHIIKSDADTALLRREAELHQIHAENIKSEIEHYQRSATPLANLFSQMVEKDIAVVRQDIADVRTQITTFETTLGIPLGSVASYFERFKKGDNVCRGRLAEDKYCSLLVDALPQREVTMCRNDAHSMDIRVRSPDGNRQDILIDVKDYSQNVSSKEIKKFHDDIKTNGTSGILLSARTGVATKHQMQIDIIDGRYAAIYLCNVGDDISSVVSAISVVESLDRHLSQNEGSTNIDKEAIRKLSEKLKEFDTLIRELKDSIEKQRRTLSKIDITSALSLIDGDMIYKNPNSIKTAQSPENKHTSCSVKQGDMENIKAFVDKCITLDPNSRMTLNQAVTSWNRLMPMKCPSSEILKTGLIQHLNTQCFKKKTIDRITLYSVFVGYKIIESDVDEGVSFEV